MSSGPHGLVDNCNGERKLMPAIPVSFETFSWPTKSAAKAAFRAILNDVRYEIGDPVTDPTQVAMLYEALDRHPDSAEKTGDGVDYFYVGKTSQDKAAFVRKDARGIWIRRVNGSAEDFSYQTAIDGRSAKNDAKDAMRAAVIEHRLRYRDRRFAAGAQVVSFISGEPINEPADAQTIYVAPEWGQLTFRFASDFGGWDKIVVASGGGAVQVGGRIADPAVETAWLEFHAKYARLELATASEAARRTRSPEEAWTPEGLDV